MTHISLDGPRVAEAALPEVPKVVPSQAFAPQMAKGAELGPKGVDPIRRRVKAAALGRFYDNPCNSL